MDGIGAPTIMIVLAKANGARALAAGGITAVAVVIVFGGCLMMLAR